RGFGRFAGEAVTAETALPAGGLVEVLLAVGVLRELATRDVALETDLRKLFPDAELPFEGLSLHALLSHTSGLPSLAALAPDVAPPDRDALVEWLRSSVLESEPGSCFAWSTTDTLLAWAWLRRASEVDFDQYAAKHLFEPLGLASATFAEGSGLRFVDGVADLGRGEPFHYELLDLPGAARLRLSAPDVLAWHHALEDRALLDEASSRALLGDTRLADGSLTGHGYGVHRTRLDDFEGYCYGGGLGAGAVRVASYPELGLSIAVLAAGPLDSLAGLERAISRAVFDLPSPEPLDLPLEESQRARYAGVYQIGCDRLVVADEEGRLALALADETHPLRYQGGNEFASAVDAGLRLRFVLNSAGEVVAFVLDDHGAEAIARRFG
ncbi:MAG TPA: serine hydrolase domain-containing protein, partial [Planctomycetota bacterium]|nr:serine hydrolase domain-containing protein [Planctomycetota bacterium]